MSRWTGRCVWGVSYDGHKTTGISAPPPDAIPNPTVARSLVVLSTSEDKMIQTTLGRHLKMVYAAGAGYKILCVIDGLVSSYLLSKGSTFKWDTCGPHAILLAQGGGIVDYEMAVSVVRSQQDGTRQDLVDLLDGCQLRYHSPNMQAEGESIEQWCNANGVIAYSDVTCLVDLLKIMV
jgi:inositol polyphosphate 1-phosphatase